MYKMKIYQNQLTNSDYYNPNQNRFEIGSDNSPNTEELENIIDNAIVDENKYYKMRNGNYTSTKKIILLK